MGILTLLDSLDIPVAAANRRVLETSARQRQGRVIELGRYDAGNVLQVVGANHRPREVWVSPAYRNYLEAWTAVFGTPSAYMATWARATGQPLGGIDIDHLLAHSVGSRLGYGYLRLFPVEKAVNQHTGRSLEKAVLGNTRGGNVQERPMYRNGMEMLNIFGLAKALNFSLIHARYSGKADTGPNRNRGFLELWDDETRTLRVLREIGFYWW